MACRTIRNEQQHQRTVLLEGVQAVPVHVNGVVPRPTDLDNDGNLRALKVAEDVDPDLCGNNIK